VKGRYILTKDAGKTTTTDTGDVEIGDIPTKNKNGVSAEVEMQVGFARGYGEIKVTAQVRLTCAQTSEAIEQAGKAAHLAACGLAFDGFNDVCDAMGVSKS